MNSSHELKLRGFRLSGFQAALRQVPGDSSLLSPLKEFSRLSDVWVKHVLAMPRHQSYILDLLNAIFEEELPPCMEQGETITSIRYPDRELIKEHLNERGAVLDILVETSQGQLINIEVYQYLRPGIKTSSSRQGIDNTTGKTGRVKDTAGTASDTAALATKERLKPVIVINLLSQELFRELPEKFVHPFALLHRNHPEILGSDKLYLYFI